MKKLIALFCFIAVTLTVISTTLFQNQTRKPASIGIAPPHLGFDNDIIYYIMIDRFYDSNYQNNVSNWAYPINFKSNSKEPEIAAANNDQRFWQKQMMDWTKSKKFQHYWGGDLQGVIHRLPYLKEMGITTVLVSPINDNVNGMFYNNGNSAYHGYWIKDWFRIDEHFANPPSGHLKLDDALRGQELVQELTSKAHAMGMKVLLDMSLNQSSPIQSQFNPFYFLENGAIYRDGEPLLQFCYPNPGHPKNSEMCETKEDHYLCGKIHKTRISKGQNVTCEKNGNHYLCGSEYKKEIKGPCQEFDDHYICRDEVEKWVHKELGPCKPSGDRYACGGGNLTYFSGPCKELENGHYNCQNIVNKKIAKENITCLDSLDTSGWFNPFEPLENWDDAKHVERSLIESMADLNQHNSGMKNYLFEASKHWLDLGFDGFRIDGVKHIYKDFLKEYESVIHEHKPNSILIGEYFEGGHFSKPSIDWLKDNDHYTMFDFFFSKHLHNYFKGKTDYLEHGSFKGFEILLNNSQQKGYHKENKLEERTNELVTFINNHDSPRMLSEEGITIDHYKAALKLLFTSRGIPTLLYGDEIGLAVPHDRRYDTMILGIGGDPWNRLMMRWDHIPERLKFGDDLNEEENEEIIYDYEWYEEFIRNGYRFPNDEIVLTSEELRKKDIRDNEILREKEIYQLTKKLISLRKSSDLFRFGNTQVLVAKKNLLEFFKIDLTPYNYLAIERSILGGLTKEDDKLSYFFWSDKKQSLRFEVKLPDGIYTDTIEDDNKTYRVTDGVIALEMEPQQVVIITKGLAPLKKPEQEIPTVETIINLTVDSIKANQQIYITGHAPLFGKWVGTEAIGPLKRKGYGKYQIKLHLPQGMHSEFKFIKMDKYGNQQWETIPNRLLYVDNEKQILEAHWNSLN